MILFDTSAWITVYRDRSGQSAKQMRAIVGGDVVATADCIVCELLQGAHDDLEWQRIEGAVSAFPTLPLSRTIWLGAAKIFHDLQRVSITVRSTIDCCIAELALANDAKLLHVDRDFERIAMVRSLKQVRLSAAGATP